jgi:ketosteroid isomerase-like protein
MAVRRMLAGTLVALAAVTGRPADAQTPSSATPRAIADTVGRLFAAIPTLTNALDLDGLVGQYRDSEALAYVANGRVIRSYAAMRDLVHAQLDGVTTADLRWLDTRVDVLADDVAIATATFAFAVTLANGATASSSGTYSAVYVRRDGDWKIEYSVHTFPRART